MTHHRGILWGSILLMTFLLAGCPNQAPPGPTAPTPPSITLATVVNTLAQSLNTATIGLVAARDQGKLSQADLNAALEVSKVIATAGKAIDAELKTTDAWEVQKTKILNILTQTGLQASYAKLPPAAAAILAASVTVFNQISASVGGFQL